MKWHLLLLLLHMCIADEYYNNLARLVHLARTDAQPLDLTHTNFKSLTNSQVNASPAPESKYPWVGRVVHSRVSNIPYMCTAVCIDSRIFVTAAKCIVSLKIRYTRVHYNSLRIPVLAFVIPSNASKQFFDDIGFIVVEAVDAEPDSWHTIALFNAVNRTDEHFHWYINLETTYGHIDYKVVGYAKPKAVQAESNTQYNLFELNVYSNINTCSGVMTRFGIIHNSFRVPCYHACHQQDIEGHVRKKKIIPKCNDYLGVEGGAVIDTRTNRLIGVATWGDSYHEYALPVGYAVANSKNFFDDYKCAILIRDDNSFEIAKGYYQYKCVQIINRR